MQIYCHGKLCHFHSLSDGCRTDWLHLVTSTYASWTGVNMAAYQCRGEIYYVTTKAIRQGGELVLGLNNTEVDPAWIEKEKSNGKQTIYMYFQTCLFLQRLAFCSQCVTVTSTCVFFLAIVQNLGEASRFTSRKKNN